jgi:murein DD-endopeptidase MepM/ murein hydrolase activator NlpD
MKLHWLRALFLVGGSLFPPIAFTQYPQIEQLNGKDILFLQLQEDIQKNRERLARINISPERVEQDSIKTLIEELLVCKYTVREGDDLFSIGARCNLPYETIATLNRLRHPSELKKGMTILIPSLPGIFIPQKPETDLEYLLQQAHRKEISYSISLSPKGIPISYDVYPGASLSPTERAFFLNVAFRLPLRRYTLTSSYGIRKDPFTGTIQRHEGIDLAAPEETEVFPTRPGRVIETGYNAVYGNYIKIEHEGGWTSVYGHLKTILVDLHKDVFSSTVIGTVGTTGQSTGPHLHFEIRQNGKTRDPASMVPLQGKGR